MTLRLKICYLVIVSDVLRIANLFFVESVEINSYANVLKNGAKINENGATGVNESISSSGPTIHRAMNMNLWSPEAVYTTTPTQFPIKSEETTVSSSGRAVIETKPFPFLTLNPTRDSYRPPPPRLPFLNNARRPPPAPRRLYPVYARPTYTAELNKIRGQAPAMDRFFPGEGVATAKFKKQAQGYNYQLPQSEPTVKDPTAGYIPPKNLYAFPPNIDSNYLPPTKASPIKSAVSSYLPPAAGPVESGMIYYAGPVNPEYLPSYSEKPKSEDPKPKKNVDDAAPVTDTGGGDDAGGDNSDSDAGKMSEASDEDHDHDHDYHYPNIHDYLPADDSQIDNGKSESPPMMTESDGGDIDMMTDSGSMDSSAPMPSDDHHHHHHHSHDTVIPPWANFYGSHGHDAYPEIIFDDHNFHHHHHHPHPPTEMTTTTEAPPEPRVKKYSYFYLGRKLWYIPLYFTVWFSFYVAFLILRSISRHKVDLPNHYVTRRSVLQDLSHKEITEKVDKLTTFVMTQIEDFKEKNF